MAALKPLSDAQKLILSTAATRPDHHVFPLPAEFRARGAVRQKVLQALLKAGFVAERLTSDDTQLWRRDARQRRLTLAMTAAGSTAIGCTAISSIPISLAASAADTATVAPMIEAAGGGVPASPTTAPGGKLGAVLSALATEDGVTLAALVSLTGWLPHTARAALCRLRQRGYPIRLLGTAGSRAYHLDTPALG